MSDERQTCPDCGERLVDMFHHKDRGSCPYKFAFVTRGMRERAEQEDEDA